MCLAIPGRIIEIRKQEDSADDIAIVDYGGLKKEANISLVEVSVGDYVLVHVGFAIQKVDEKFARETYSLLSDVKL
jgi:hydrogenase expression/formation protein HypC